QHFLLERRVTGARLDTAPALARELVDLNVDLILTVVTGMAVPGRAGAGGVPLVVVMSGGPGAAGCGNRLSIAGGAARGNSSYVGPEVFGKYFELLAALSPQRIARVGVFWDYIPPAITRAEADLALDGMRRAGRELRITVTVRESRSVDDIGRALTDFAQ